MKIRIIRLLIKQVRYHCFELIWVVVNFLIWDSHKGFVVKKFLVGLVRLIRMRV